MCYYKRGAVDVTKDIVLKVLVKVPVGAAELGAAAGPLGCLEDSQGLAAAVEAGVWPGEELVVVHQFQARVRMDRNMSGGWLARLNKELKGYIGWRLVCLGAVSSLTEGC